VRKIQVLRTAKRNTTGTALTAVTARSSIGKEGPTTTWTTAKATLVMTKLRSNKPKAAPTKRPRWHSHFTVSLQ
jgi:hypothetical protein